MSSDRLQDNKQRLPAGEIREVGDSSHEEFIFSASIMHPRWLRRGNIIRIEEARGSRLTSHEWGIKRYCRRASLLTVYRSLFSGNPINKSSPQFIIRRDRDERLHGTLSAVDKIGRGSSLASAELILDYISLPFINKHSKTNQHKRP